MRRYIPILAAAVLSLSAAAVPAKRITRSVTLADGTQTTVTLTGDEFCRFYLTPDNQVLMPDEQGKLYYAAESADGRLIRSALPATSEIKASAQLDALRPAINKNIRSKAPQTRLFPAAEASATTNTSKGIGLYADSYVKGIGSPRCLVILVEYSDVEFSISDPGDYFNRQINQTGFSDNGATGSVVDYFTEASTGQFKPVFDVLGPVTLPNKRSYYGGNNIYGDDKAAEDMVRHAAAILDDEVDFSVYDNDGDGVVDNVYIIYAGKGEASGGTADTVWPHSYDLSATGSRYLVDGVYIDHYGCSNELEGNTIDGIGTFVHEFSHVLGLPDLYTTTYGNAASLTPGAYSVLDYGPYNNNGRTPPTYSAFERNAMGWIDCQVLDEPCRIEMEHILTSNKAYIIPTGDKNEFFLLENRQQAGSDRYIPGHGMLIWHIDYNSSVWNSNAVNNTSSHQYVDIEEANGVSNNQNTTTMAGYPFPGTSAKTEFTAFTTPALKTWSGTAIDMPITDIAENSGVITAKAAGGIPEPSLDVPVTSAATEITADGFTASWEPVEDATDYEITVYACHQGVSTPLPAIGFDNSALPSGWSATRADWYRTAAYAGESVPSFRFAANGRYLQSPEFEGKVASLSFWAICLPSSTSQAPSSLRVLNGTASSGKEIATITDLGSKGRRYDITANLSDVSRITFVGQITNGYIAIDDINISISAESSSVVPEYDARSTSGACTVTVTGLPDADRYAYSVVAINSQLRSKPSELVYVGSPAGIDNVTADECDTPVEYYNLQGIRIAHPAPGQPVIVKQGKKVTKSVF